jgi:hypothetical protein
VRIARQGARDDGAYQIELHKPQFAWDREKHLVSVTAQNVLDFFKQSTHDYQVTFSIAEIQAILRALCDAVSEPACDDIAVALGSSVRDLSGLLASSLGLRVTPRTAAHGAHPARR